MPGDFSTRPEIDTALSGARATGIAPPPRSMQDRPARRAHLLRRQDHRRRPVNTSTDEMRSQIAGTGPPRAAAPSSCSRLPHVQLDGPTGRWRGANSGAGAQRLATGLAEPTWGRSGGPPELKRLSATFDEMAARLGMLVGSSAGSSRTSPSSAPRSHRPPGSRVRVDGRRARRPRTPTDCANDVDAVRGEIRTTHPRRRGLLALTRADETGIVATGGRRRSCLSGAGHWGALARTIRGHRHRRAAASRHRRVPVGIDRSSTSWTAHRRSGDTAIDITVRPLNRSSSVSVTGDRDSTRNPTRATRAVPAMGRRRARWNRLGLRDRR